MFALILIGCAKCDESANTCDTLPRNAEFGSIFINGILSWNFMNKMKYLVHVSVK